jgi:hypothetical protein
MHHLLLSLALCLSSFTGYKFNSDDLNALGYHRIVEAFKFAYGQRLHLGDPLNENVDEVKSGPNRCLNS